MRRNCELPVQCQIILVSKGEHLSFCLSSIVAQEILHSCFVSAYQRSSSQSMLKCSNLQAPPEHRLIERKYTCCSLKPAARLHPFEQLPLHSNVLKFNNQESCFIYSQTYDLEA
jgi:hypothetical protein